MTDVQPATGTDRDATGPARRGAPTTRRGLLAGAGAVGAAGLLGACGTGNNPSGGGSGIATGVQEPIPAGSSNTGAGGKSGDARGKTLAAVADVPVGGGVILSSMVITQPTEGEFKAFDRICTHAKCPVAEVKDGTINCKCHGSRFSIEDGSVQGGPAPAPLAARSVKVDGDNIVSG